MSILDPASMVSMLEDAAPTEGDVAVGAYGVDSIHWKRGPFVQGLTGGLKAPVTLTVDLPLIGTQVIPLGIEVSVAGPVTDENGTPIGTASFGGLGLGLGAVVAAGLAAYLLRKR